MELLSQLLAMALAIRLYLVINRQNAFSRTPSGDGLHGDAVQ